MASDPARAGVYRFEACGRHRHDFIMSNDCWYHCKNTYATREWIIGRDAEDEGRQMRMHACASDTCQLAPNMIVHITASMLVCCKV
jgi:hypothetical protein